MTVWALGHVSDAHAPIRSLEEVRADLRFRHEYAIAAGNAHGAHELQQQLADIEAEIALRTKR